MTVDPFATAVTAVPPQRRLRPVEQKALILIGRDHLSHSSLGLMRSCPKKYSFQYVQRAVPTFISSSLLFGGAIHSGIQRFYEAAMSGEVADREHMLTGFREEWARGANNLDGAPVRFNANESAEALEDLAGRIFDAFLASPLAHLQGQIIGVEETFRATLDLAMPDLLGRADLVYIDDEAVHIVDFKTARSRWTQAQVQQATDQLALYAVMARKLAGEYSLPICLHFAVLTKAISPVVQIIDVIVNAERLSGLAAMMLQIWHAIEGRHFYPNPSPINCTSCQFFAHCPAMAAGGAR